MNRVKVELEYRYPNAPQTNGTLPIPLTIDTTFSALDDPGIQQKLESYVGEYPLEHSTAEDKPWKKQLEDSLVGLQGSSVKSVLLKQVTFFVLLLKY